MKKLLGRAAIRLGILLLLAFYLVQQSRMAENHTDGGLILTYVDDIANGLMPNRDFIDAYGLLNWPAVVGFYKLAGQKVWGIRLWMLILKIIIVVVTFRFVRRLSGTFYATLAALWMMLLYGMAWQSLQTAYGFNNVIPFVLGSWYFLLSGPFPKRANMVMAGLFTGIAIWIKINAGLFLLAAGLFHCFYWLPAPEGVTERPLPQWFPRLFRLGQYVGLVLYGIIFYGYVRQYFDAWYFVYLVGPLLIGLAYTAQHLVLMPVSSVPVRHHLGTFAIYGGVTVAFSVVMLFVATGGIGVSQYVKDQADIMLYLDYMLPFSQLGVPEEFIGFNENYWLQLPWLFTLVFLGWTQLQFNGRGRAAFGDKYDVEVSRGVGLYMMTTLYQFCMYSRADETHVFQAMVMVPPALFGLLEQMERLMLVGQPGPNRPFRFAVGTVALLWGSTIAVKPGFAVFDLTTGERKHPKLQYMRYRELDNPYVRDFTPDLTDHEWDRHVDEASQFVDDIVPDNDPILVLDANRLIHVLSNTRPVGGRYHFYFYLIATKLYKRPGFEKAVPPYVLKEILDNPPLVAIDSYERVPPVAKAFPEFRKMIAEKYTFVKNFRHILIYVLKEEYRKKPSPVAQTAAPASLNARTASTQ